MNTKFSRWVLVAMVLIGVSLSSVAVTAGDKYTFEDKHQVGVRLGGWANNGDTHPARLEDPIYKLRTDISNANAYFEVYGALRVVPGGMLEFSLGFVNRGEVTLVEGQNEYIGNLILYPILASFKYYLPMNITGRFRPYVQAGGGLYYGRHSVQYTNDYYYAFAEESGTDFNYVLGGGLDWPVASSVGLDLNIKYMPITYDKKLIVVSDYQAFTISVGVKYLFKSEEKR